MKKIISLIFLVLVSIGLVSCGGEKEKIASDELVIAGIYKAGDQTWFIDEGKAAEKAAKEMGATKFIYIDAQMNPDTYLSALENIIIQKVDGVLICVPDQNLSEVTVSKLKEAGIPVIAVDDALIDQQGELIAPWVGISSKKIGLSVGKWSANYIKENKLENDESVGILILTMDTVSSVVPRTDGELEAISEILPNFSKDRIFKSDYNGETDKGYNAAAAIITANPNIEKWIVMGGNEEGTIGAVRALEQSGKDKESVVIGMGGYLAIGEFEKEYSAMKVAPYFSADEIGGESARLLIKNIKNGEEIPMKTAVDALMITKENYKEVTE